MILPVYFSEPPFAIKANCVVELSGIEIGGTATGKIPPLLPTATLVGMGWGLTWIFETNRDWVTPDDGEGRTDGDVRREVGVFGTCSDCTERVSS